MVDLSSTLAYNGNVEKGDGNMLDWENLINCSKEDIDNACYEKLDRLESEVTGAINSNKEYIETFLVLTNHVTTVTTLNKDEYYGFLEAVQDYMDEYECAKNIYESDYEDTIVGRTLRILAINAQFGKLNPKLDCALEYIATIEKRLECSDFKNTHFVPLIQLVWQKFSDELDQFSYDNLEEQSCNQQPWLVVDTNEIVYITSFPNKTDAQKYVMQHKGLNHKNIVCRY